MITPNNHWERQYYHVLISYKLLAKTAQKVVSARWSNLFYLFFQHLYRAIGTLHILSFSIINTLPSPRKFCQLPWLLLLLYHQLQVIFHRLASTTAEVQLRELQIPNCKHVLDKLPVKQSLLGGNRTFYLEIFSLSQVQSTTWNQQCSLFLGSDDLKLFVGRSRKLGSCFYFSSWL